MTEPLRPRAKYVIGPDGSPLTIADLPAPGTKRWVIRRKAEVVAAVRGGLDGGVGDDLPVGGGCHREPVGGLQVGLVEAGEHPLRVGRLELAVEVDAAVDRIEEPVQAFAGVHVPPRGPHDQLLDTSPLYRELATHQLLVS